MENGIYILKALGYEIGKSLVEEDLIPEAIKIMEEAKSWS